MAALQRTMMIRRSMSTAAAAECGSRLTRISLHAPKSAEEIRRGGYGHSASGNFDMPSSFFLLAVGSGSPVLNTRVEVEFANGRLYCLSAEFLRVHSPAADSKIRSVGGEKVISGRRYVGIISAEPVGNYGVRLLFDDLHKTGIYTWDYFYHLGTNKFSLMRSYINTLRKHGLSRDPRRK